MFHSPNSYGSFQMISPRMLMAIYPKRRYCTLDAYLARICTNLFQLIACFHRMYINYNHHNSTYDLCLRKIHLKKKTYLNLFHCNLFSTYIISIYLPGILRYALIFKDKLKYSHCLRRRDFKISFCLRSLASGV